MTCFDSCFSFFFDTKYRVKHFLRFDYSTSGATQVRKKKGAEFKGIVEKLRQGQAVFGGTVLVDDRHTATVI